MAQDEAKNLGYGKEFEDQVAKRGLAQSNNTTTLQSDGQSDQG
jgi:hypothetical protein